MFLLPQLLDYVSLAPVSCLGQLEQLDYLRLNVNTLTAVEYNMMILVCVVAVGLGCLWHSLLKSLHSGAYTLPRPLFLSQSLASNPQGSATPRGHPFGDEMTKALYSWVFPVRSGSKWLGWRGSHSTEMRKAARERKDPNSSPTNLHSTSRWENSQVVPVKSRRRLLTHTK